MIKVGLIGYGYWGPNLLRNFNANATFQVVAVAESERGTACRSAPNGALRASF